MLLLRDFVLSRSGQCLLRCEELRAAAPGLLFLVGPGGAGKSSLLAALAHAGAERELELRGRVEFARRPLAETASRVHLAQHARLEGTGSVADALRERHGLGLGGFCAGLRELGLGHLADEIDAPLALLIRSERRLLEVLARLRMPAALYLVDEPTADLDDAALQAVRSVLADLHRRACVVIATHNRQDCLALGGQVVLLAGGTVQECADCERFFSEPATEAGRIYVETGNCNLPRPQPAPDGRDGVWWLVPGLLCGMSRPNLFHAIDARLSDLHARGVRHLVCLEERLPYAPQVVRAHGIALHHVPVTDMGAPAFGQAVDLCRALEPAIQANEAVAMHCRGGLGRTGTALAALLVWFGDSAEQAIAKVRRAQPLAIQSHPQLRFLDDFAGRIRGWHPAAARQLEV